MVLDPFNDDIRNDPRYLEGMEHLQHGRWVEAIELLESLSEDYPDDPKLPDVVADARFRALVDKTARVNPKRTFFRWRPIAIRVMLVIAAIAVGYMLINLVRERISPLIAQARGERQLEALCADGDKFREGGELDKAKEKYLALQGSVPDSACAADGLAAIAEMEGKSARCAAAEALFNVDNPDSWRQAREAFQQIALELPGTCNAYTRIAEIGNRLLRMDLDAASEAAWASGDCHETVIQYENLKRLDATYKRAMVDDRLYQCYVILGLAVVNSSPPAPERIGEALGYFDRALELRPRDLQASSEQRLASQFLAGQEAASEGRPADVAMRLEPVVASRALYLGGAALPLLYDAYITLGDGFRGSGDCGLAYDNYRKAYALPRDDKALASERLDTVRGCLTPTPSPTPTPTITPIPTATAYIYVPPTPIPSITPPPPLASLRGQIVFKSDKPGFEGFWVINPDGSGKRFLGSGGKKIENEYNGLIIKDQFSPDGKWRLYSTKGQGSDAVQVWYQGKDGNNVITKQVTNLTKLNYDPVWAPDGSRIAFVSQDKTSDDIWVINPDGTNAWNYTPNEWEWDKHPSWSADSRKITFWSNREGTKQIYVMDADGRNQRKISGEAPWDEYDPVWIK